jgi:ABC-type transport system involved in multi-copper enzyme maturation permease subunit
VTIHPPRYLLAERKVLGRRDRIWALFSANVRLRGFRLGPMLLIAFGLMATVIPLILIVLIESLLTGKTNLSLSQFYAAYSVDSTILFLFVLLMTSLVGAGIVSDDLKSKAITLYLSRPITIMDYIIGKGGVVVALLALLAILPGEITTLLALVLGWATLTVAGEAALAFLAVGVLTTVVFAGLALLLSSLTVRKAFAGVGIFAIFLIDYLFALGLAGATGDLSWLYISPGEDILAVAQSLFQYTSLTPVIDAGVAFAVLVPLILVLYGLTYLRLSFIEVVTD